ncbi:MAG: putative endonuclease [Parcubacteria group bacterium Athens1014_10]|nr:MAG: putative endonuclease [Parcubacteria group bacterium Athens1014_10]TSD05114.1 MAG: putative endonuclease [Parcubacteria group bacterium Athens0714_12]
MWQKQKIGKTGEEIAKKYFKKKGYKILEQHYCLRGGEIDLIVQKEEKIIFVEVKTRTSDEFGNPEESINYYKQKSLNRAINNYFFKKRIENNDYQFDVVSIMLDKKERKALIKHFKNVQLAQLN